MRFGDAVFAGVTVIAGAGFTIAFFFVGHFHLALASFVCVVAAAASLLS